MAQSKPRGSGRQYDGTRTSKGTSSSSHHKAAPHKVQSTLDGYLKPKRKSTTPVIPSQIGLTQGRTSGSQSADRQNHPPPAAMTSVSKGKRRAVEADLSDEEVPMGRSHSARMHLRGGEGSAPDASNQCSQNHPMEALVSQVGGSRALQSTAQPADSFVHEARERDHDQPRYSQMTSLPWQKAARERMPEYRKAAKLLSPKKTAEEARAEIVAAAGAAMRKTYTNYLGHLAPQDSAGLQALLENSNHSDSDWGEGAGELERVTGSPPRQPGIYDEGRSPTAQFAKSRRSAEGSVARSTKRYVELVLDDEVGTSSSSRPVSRKLKPSTEPQAVCEQAQSAVADPAVAAAAEFKAKESTDVRTDLRPSIRGTTPPPLSDLTRESLSLGVFFPPDQGTQSHSVPDSEDTERRAWRTMMRAWQAETRLPVQSPRSGRVILAFDTQTQALTSQQRLITGALSSRSEPATRFNGPAGDAPSALARHSDDHPAKRSMQSNFRFFRVQTGHRTPSRQHSSSSKHSSGNEQPKGVVPDDADRSEMSMPNSPTVDARQRVQLSSSRRPHALTLGTRFDSAPSLQPGRLDASPSTPAKIRLQREEPASKSDDVSSSQTDLLAAESDDDMGSDASDRVLIRQRSNANATKDAPMANVEFDHSPQGLSLEPHPGGSVEYASTPHRSTAAATRTGSRSGSVHRPSRTSPQARAAKQWKLLDEIWSSIDLSKPKPSQTPASQRIKKRQTTLGTHGFGVPRTQEQKADDRQQEKKREWKERLDEQHDVAPDQVLPGQSLMGQDLELEVSEDEGEEGQPGEVITRTEQAAMNVDGQRLTTSRTEELDDATQLLPFDEDMEDDVTPSRDGHQAIAEAATTEKVQLAGQNGEEVAPPQQDSITRCIRAKRSLVKMTDLPLTSPHCELAEETLPLPAEEKEDAMSPANEMVVSDNPSPFDDLDETQPLPFDDDDDGDRTHLQPVNAQPAIAERAEGSPQALQMKQLRPLSQWTVTETEGSEPDLETQHLPFSDDSDQEGDDDPSGNVPHQGYAVQPPATKSLSASTHGQAARPPIAAGSGHSGQGRTSSSSTTTSDSSVPIPTRQRARQDLGEAIFSSSQTSS